MKLKKMIAALAVSAALTVGAVAENHPYGMDIAVGIIGIESTTISYDWWQNNWTRRTVEAKEIGVNFFPLKINTYLCPWLNHHLGLYGSVGLLPGIHIPDNNANNNVSFVIAGEFMFGPAFGVDLGESSVRFQVGAPFHAVVGGGKTYLGVNWNNNNNVTTIAEQDYFYYGLGIGLTPQFRFGANKRCSFVVGMDFVFDFAGNVKVANTWANPDRFFRFSWTPYLGLGINFGD